MMALTFFGILHVPINVPAIGVTIKQDDVDVNQELISHGWANLISGCLGSLQNYLMYSSSVLFIKSGGHSRYAGMMLAIATFCAWLIGPSMVAYIPSVVVGSLIFHLGLELFKEGVYETWGIMDPLEYTTIWLIVVVMALLGFVEGVVIGIVLACCFFVYLYSSRAPIRVAYSGAAAKSTVRRVYRHRAFLDQVRNQIQVVKLQGFLFFGTINQVEKRIRDMLDERQWSTNPIRFLILDFSLVNGVDFSGAEAFIRIRRILLAKRVHMVVCGVTSTSEVGIALHSVGIWNPNPNEEDLTRTFQTLNDGLEWCENFMLETCYRRQMQRSLPAALPNHGDDNLAANQLTAHSVATNRESTRSMLLDQAAIETLLTEASNLPTSTLSQPLALLVQIFTESENIIDDALYQISSSFECIKVKPGEVIWHQGDEANGLYLVEQGLFKVSITTVSGASKVVESIIPGSMLGELALFTNRPRSGTVTADQEGIVWRLTKDKFHELCAQNPSLMLKFVQMALAYSAQDMNVYSVQAFELM
jgi:SulP family sulfate permease